MVHSEKDLRRWKNEQVNYFKNYLNNFEKDSKEYKRLEKGIEDLEKSI